MINAAAPPSNFSWRSSHGRREPETGLRRPFSAYTSTAERFARFHAERKHSTLLDEVTRKDERISPHSLRHTNGHQRSMQECRITSCRMPQDTPPVRRRALRTERGISAMVTQPRLASHVLAKRRTAGCSRRTLRAEGAGL